MLHNTRVEPANIFQRRTVRDRLWVRVRITRQGQIRGRVGSVTDPEENLLRQMMRIAGQSIAMGWIRIISRGQSRRHRQRPVIFGIILI